MQQGFQIMILKNEGSWGMKIWKICILRAEILAKTRLKIQFFQKIENWGT